VTSYVSSHQTTGQSTRTGLTQPQAREVVTTLQGDIRTNQFGLTQTQTQEFVDTVQEKIEGRSAENSFGGATKNLANHLLTSNLVSGQVTNSFGRGGATTTQVTRQGETTVTSQTRTTENVVSSGSRHVTSTKASKKGPVTKDGKLIIYEEVPVFVEKIVEVPFDNIIERPVEKRIENRYYVDREVEVERVVVKEVPKIIEIKKEKIIEVEKFVDEEEVKENHIDVVEEVIKVVEVPEIVYEDEIHYKDVEILKVRPHRTDIKENIIYKDKINVVDQIVEKDKVITNNIYIEKSTGQRVDNYDPYAQVKIIEEVEEEPYNVYVDKIIEVKKEVPYEVVKEVDNVIIDRVPVERTVVHTEYYDDIKIKEVPVENVIEKKVEKQVLVDKYVDKEKIVEVEVKVPVEKRVEKIITKVIDVPVIREVVVEVPYANVVENHTTTDVEMFIAEPKVTHVNKEYAIIEETDENEDLEIEFEVDKIVENEVHTINEVPVDIKKQVINEVHKQSQYDKEVHLQRIVEKPNVRASYRDVPVPVNVQQSIVITQPVVNQNVKIVNKDKHIDVVHTNEVVQYNEVQQALELKKEQKTSKMTTHQKRHLESVTNETSRIQLDNLKLRTDIQAYEEHISQIRGVIIDDESLENNKREFREKIARLDNLINECTTESRQIEYNLRVDETNVNQYEDVEVYTEQEILRLEEQIREVEERNQQLRQLLGKVDIRSSKVGEMSSVNVKESMRMTREVEQKLNSYENDPNARITQGQKMTTSVYVPKNLGNSVQTRNVTSTSTRTFTSGGNQGRTVTSGVTRVSGGNQGRTVTSGVTRVSGGNQVRTVTSGVTRVSGGNQGRTVTSGVTRVSGGNQGGVSRGYTSTSTGSHVTKTGYTTTNTTGGYTTGGYTTGGVTSTSRQVTTSQSKTVTTTGANGQSKTTVSESYTNSAHPEKNYSYTNTSNTPYNVVTNNAIRASKVIKESPGEYVQSRSLVTSEDNRPKLFNSRGYEESRVITTSKNVTSYQS
jgi:hypothetical protein